MSKSAVWARLAVEVKRFDDSEWISSKVSLRSGAALGVDLPREQGTAPLSLQGEALTASM